MTDQNHSVLGKREDWEDKTPPPEAKIRSQIQWYEKLHQGAQELFTREDFDLNATDPYGQTPLIIAAEKGRLDLVKLLLDHKADIDFRDNAGKTALNIAAKRGHTNVIRLLLKRGANPLIPSRRGLTPMHTGAEYGWKRVVRAFLKAGVPGDIETDQGWTPIHCAAENDHIGVLECFNSEGLDLNEKAHGGLTPLHAAALCKYQPIVEYLLKHIPSKFPEDLETFPEFRDLVRYRESNSEIYLLEQSEMIGLLKKVPNYPLAVLNYLLDYFLDYWWRGFAIQGYSPSVLVFITKTILTIGKHNAITIGYRIIHYQFCIISFVSVKKSMVFAGVHPSSYCLLGESTRAPWASRTRWFFGDRKNQNRSQNAIFCFLLLPRS
jgi:hypothetical protein